MQRSSRWQWIAARTAAAALLIGLVSWGLARVARPAEPEDGHWLKATRQASSQPLLLQGALRPVDAVNIAAPVEGVLLAKFVQFGDAVTAGQKLAQVSDTELRRQLREAEIASIQAQQALNTAQQIESSTEYQAATRRLLAAQNSLAAAQRRGREAQMLYEKGIIARTELEAGKQEIDAGQSQVDGARDEIATLRLKRTPAALRVLELDLENRQLRLEELRAKLKATTMLSPISGVVLYPEPTDGNEPSGRKELNAGAAVTPKDVILTVGDTSAFLIKTWVDEEDIRRVAPGQAVHIVLAADSDQAFAGTVQRVSSQAKAADGRGQGSRGTSEFEVQILLKPPADAGTGQSLRVGSAVTMTLAPAPGPATLRIPLAAVTWDPAGRPVVRVRKSASAAARLQEIEAARTLVDSVEVKAGLAEGDEVWMPGAAPSPADAGGGQGTLKQLLSGAGNG
ncbi:efflux RND transporter periplasmic adaptor subunit [Ralstonia solanacearum]|uniref:efflux RND transporter periplasmic adaptor subunit n=1 Tax=Ralstonia solanacearum TaxID=305 RepID=UPI000E66C765|nr:HlyD family efflux transporter periplasmic adaptor subunit [Ralstonia solanacearum]QOK84839.1 HlyD family efflux transporter periplasmic adaptor subunit [Ralstonia solanacearum]RIJ84112.1 ABC transporter ATP-binding protein [Ralstonia solanacearum]